MSKLSCTGFIFACKSFFVTAPFNPKPRVRIEEKKVLATPTRKHCLQILETISEKVLPLLF